MRLRFDEADEAERNKIVMAVRCALAALDRREEWRQ